jgi:hypothetical protein
MYAFSFIVALEVSGISKVTLDSRARGLPRGVKDFYFNFSFDASSI